MIFQKHIRYHALRSDIYCIVPDMNGSMDLAEVTHREGQIKVTKVFSVQNIGKAVLVLPFFLVFLQLFLVFPSIPPSSLRELLVFLVSLKSFCFFRCTPAFLEALLISMVFLMRAPDFSPVPPDKHEAFLVLIPCVRCLHSCSILPVI